MKAKYFILISLLSISLIPTSAQDPTPLPTEEEKGGRCVEAALGVDLGGRRITTLGISWKGLSLSAWGSVGISDFSDDKELDLTLAYSIKGFNVGITDYWFSQGSYFQYKYGKTTHIWEANVGYDFGFLSLQWYTNFAGNDGTNKDSKRAFSSYFELAAPFRLGGLDWSASLGIVPWATTSYNSNGFCVTNVSLRATKDFVIKEKYHLPVYAGLIANPRNEKVYLLFGVAFSM